MLKHKFIVDKLSEAQKIKLLSDVRVLSTAEYTKFGIPMLSIESIYGYKTDVYPSPISLANSWNERIVGEVASDIAVSMSAEQINVAGILSPIPKLNMTDRAISEDPLLSAKISSAYMGSIGKTGIAVTLDDIFFDEQDVSCLDHTPNSRFLNEFVYRAVSNTVENKKCHAVTVGADIDIKGYENINSEITERVATIGGEKFVLCKNIAPEDTVIRIVKGQICLDGCEPVLKAAIDRYARLKEGIKRGRVTVCELEAEIENGSAFPPEKIDEAVDKVIDFAFEMTNANKGKLASYTPTSTVVKNASYESTVLLKNYKTVLPLKPGTLVTLAGDILVNYNGEDADYSDKANEAAYYLRGLGCASQGFVRAYSMAEDRSDKLFMQMEGSALNTDTVILFMGTNPQKEKAIARTENLYLPANQLAALEKLYKMGKKIIAVVSSDYAIDVTFADKVDALLVAPLNTKYGVEAVFDIITGRMGPVGRLATTWYKNTDRANKKHRFYCSMPNSKVGTYLGYRYYDKSDYDVGYPFGYGLAFSTFVYSKLSVQGTNVVFTVKNKAKVAGTEVVQVYLGINNSAIQRPKKELVGFEKIYLQPGASTTVSIPMSNIESFDPESKRWIMERGEYTVYVGSSVKDIKLTAKVSLGQDIVNSPAEDPSDYLQSESNIISNRYTLEADYKLMKRNIRNIVFGIGALVLAVAMFVFSIFSGKVSIFLNVVASILALAGVVFFILEGTDRKKAHNEERNRVNDANKAHFENATDIADFSTNAVFSEEFDRVEQKISFTKDTAPSKAESYLAFVNESLTYDAAISQFIAFAAAKGFKFNESNARELFAAMSASRLIITKGMSNDVFAELVRVVSEYFGTPMFVDAVDYSYENDNSALFKGVGAAKQRTNLTNAIYAAIESSDKVHIAALTDVNFADLSKYFVPFARYIRNPRNANIISTVDQTGEKTQITMPQNMWFMLNLRMGETMSNIPEYITELASVIKVDYIRTAPTMLYTQIVPFSYYQFDFLLDKVKTRFIISEDTWKKFDRFEAFVNGVSPYALENRVCIAVERFFAVFCAAGGDTNEAIDRAISARILSSVIITLNNAEDKENRNLTEKLEMIFGEENIDVCRAFIRAAGSNLI